MPFRSLLGLICLAGSLVACATGGKLQGTGASGGDGGAGGGEGGGTTTGNTGGEGATTTTTTTSTGTPTPTCDESPCKLVSPQCGCAAGDMCAINMKGDRECVLAGDEQPGQACTGFFSCAPGALCVQASSTTSTCSTYCDQDAQCNGGICVLGLNDPDAPGQTIPDVLLCSDDCNPLTNAGCNAALGLGCRLHQEQEGQMRVFTLCTGAGNGGQNATCADQEDCAPGSACFTFTDMSMKCLQYCNVNSPSCAQCVSLDPPLIYKGVNYGACL